MPVSDYFNTEDAWESAVRTVFVSGVTAVPSINLMTTRSGVTASNPRIQIQALNDTKASEQMAFRADGVAFYNHRALDVDLLISTDRYAAATQNHGAIRGRVRYLFSREAQSFVSPVVTYFEVLSIDESPSQIGRDNDEDHREDHTRLTFRVEYGLLPSAYPTPAV